MGKKILLTSFDVWEDHHISNSSDDLLGELLARDLLDETSYLLRKLPVSFEVAPQQVVAEVARLKPDLIICCGMAERRSRLTIETNGKNYSDIVYTSINVDRLINNLTVTEVSHDAGNFVCNHLYYSVLQYIQKNKLNSQCMFVHVPVLNETNLSEALKDFSLILQTLNQQKLSWN